MARDARIVIAERWSVLRRGMLGVLHGRHVVVDHFDDPDELRLVVANRPVDLAIVGDDDRLDLPTLLHDVGAAPAAPPVVVLVDDVDVDRLRAVLRAGARAVLSKKVDDEELLDALDRVLGGDRVIDQRYLPLLFAGPELEPTDDEDALLTPREREVLAILARGWSNRQIAESLVLGESTVKTHLGRIYAKLEVDDRHHAVGRALELGLLT